MGSHIGHSEDGLCSTRLSATAWLASLRGPLTASASALSSLSANAERRQGFVQKAALYQAEV
jgi:hypothetical protein